MKYSHRCAFEVWVRRGRVDFVSRDREGKYTFVEIKVSVADFNSRSGHNFYGDKNYYAMPADLYEKVKDKIPKGIGVLVPKILEYENLGYEKYELEVVRRAGKIDNTLTNEERNDFRRRMLTSCNSTINRLLRDYRYKITDEEKANKYLHLGSV